MDWMGMCTYLDVGVDMDIGVDVDADAEVDTGADIKQTRRGHYSFVFHDNGDRKRVFLFIP
jgi:hypothetical protein